MFKGIIVPGIIVEKFSSSYFLLIQKHFNCLRSIIQETKVGQMKLHHELVIKWSTLFHPILENLSRIIKMYCSTQFFFLRFQWAGTALGNVKVGYLFWQQLLGEHRYENKLREKCFDCSNSLPLSTCFQTITLIIL